jgi:hypothetical protein
VGLRKILDFKVPREHYQADAIIIWCFDERFDEYRERKPLIRFLFSVLFWIGMKRFNPETSLLRAYIKQKRFHHPDVIKWAGGAKPLVFEGEGNRNAFRHKLETAIRLHGAPRIVLMLHADCGAFNFGDDPSEELENHLAGLCLAGDFLKREFPDKEIELLLADFNGLYALG